MSERVCAYVCAKLRGRKRECGEERQNAMRSAYVVRAETTDRLCTQTQYYALLNDEASNPLWKVKVLRLEPTFHADAGKHVSIVMMRFAVEHCRYVV